MWHSTIGHDAIAARFAQAVEVGRLASTFLFVGPAGVGKRTFALDLARALLCLESPQHLTPPCGRCASCRQFASETHPDLELVSRRADRQQLTLDLFLGAKDHRNQEGLCHQISLKPALGTRRIAIVDDADYLTIEAANSLLKTLEEPPPHSVIILIGTSASKQLPTIRSRTQITRFGPLPVEDLAELIYQQGIADSNEVAHELARASEGSLQRAVELADDEQQQFRQRLFAWLEDASVNSVTMASELEEYVNRAGKEARHRRARLQSVFGYACDYFRGGLRAASGLPVTGDTLLTEAVARRSQQIEFCLRRLDRTLDACEQVDRNANQSTLIASWAHDVAG